MIYKILISHRTIEQSNIDDVVHWILFQIILFAMHFVFTNQFKIYQIIRG